MIMFVASLGCAQELFVYDRFVGIVVEVMEVQRDTLHVCLSIAPFSSSGSKSTRSFKLYQPSPRIVAIIQHAFLILALNYFRLMSCTIV